MWPRVSGSSPFSEASATARGRRRREGTREDLERAILQRKVVKSGPLPLQVSSQTSCYGADDDTDGGTHSRMHVYTKPFPRLTTRTPTITDAHTYTHVHTYAHAHTHVHTHIHVRQVRLPPWLSASCHSWLKALLTKDPRLRLGTDDTPSQHPFLAATGRQTQTSKRGRVGKSSAKKKTITSATITSTTAESGSEDAEGGVHIGLSTASTTPTTTTPHASTPAPHDLEKLLSKKKSNIKRRGRGEFSAIDACTNYGPRRTCWYKDCVRWMVWAAVLLLVVMAGVWGGIYTGKEVPSSSVHPVGVSFDAYRPKLSPNQSDSIDPNSHNSNGDDHLHTQYLSLDDPNLKSGPAISLSSNETYPKTHNNNNISDPNTDPPSSVPFPQYRLATALLIIKGAVRRFCFHCSGSSARIGMATASADMAREASITGVALTDRAGVTLRDRAYEFCSTHIDSEMTKCAETIVGVIYRRLNGIDT